MKVKFMIPDGMTQTTKYLTDELEKLDCECETIVVDSNLSPFEYKLLAKEHSDCDVMHIQSTYWMFGKYGQFLPSFYKGISTKCVTTLHEPVGHFHIGAVKLLTETYYRRLANISVKYSDAVLVSTEGKRQLDRIGVTSEKIRIAHRGAYANAKRLDRSKSKDIIGVGPYTILLFGRVRYGKGYDILMDVLPELDKRIDILIAGTCKKEHQSYCDELVNEAVKYPGRVKSWGFVNDSDIPSIFSASDIAVLPYRHSTQSDVIRMALAFNLPCITSDLGFFNDIRDEYDCLQIYKEGDLANTINTLMFDDDEKERLSQNSIKFYNDRNWTKIAENRMKLYRELCK